MIDCIYNKVINRKMLKAKSSNCNKERRRRTTSISNNNDNSSKESLSLLRSRNRKEFLNSNRLSKIKASLLIDNNTITGSTLLSPETHSRLRQIYIRKHGLFQTTPYYEEYKMNSNALTENFHYYNFSTSLALLSRKKTIFNSKVNPYMTQYHHHNECNYIKRNNDLFSPTLHSSNRKADEAISNNLTHLKSNNKTMPIKTKAKTNRTKPKPIIDLFSLSREKGIKLNIAHLKNFKFSIDVNAKPDELKHQKIIENNLKLLKEIRKQLKTETSFMDQCDIKDESISID